MALPTALPKAQDKRRFVGETTQVEAIPPDQLAAIVQNAIEARIDWPRYQACLEDEQVYSARLVDGLIESNLAACCRIGERCWHAEHRTTTDVPAAAVPIAYVSLTLRASRRSGPEFPYRLTAIGEHYVRQYSAGDRPPPRSSRAWLILPTAVLAA
jgi:hypothetical protein